MSREIDRLEELTGLAVRYEAHSFGDASPHPKVNCYVVAPASANTVAKLATGIADNQALTIEELDVTHLRGITRQQLAHLGTLDFTVAKENAVFLGSPGGTGKTHLAIGLAVRACQTEHCVAFATAAEWVDRLVHHAEVHSLKGDSYRMRGRLLGRVPTATHDTD